MKTERNILIAFILNLSFSVFEFIGGIFTGSVAIVSDAVHDVGDAASISQELNCNLDMLITKLLFGSSTDWREPLHQ